MGTDRLDGLRFKPGTWFTLEWAGSGEVAMTRIKTDVMLEERIAVLEAAPLRWWAGEAEVVRVYFSNPRTREDDLRWLKLQAARELGTVERLLEALPDDLARYRNGGKPRFFRGVDSVGLRRGAALPAPGRHHGADRGRAAGPARAAGVVGLPERTAWTPRPAGHERRDRGHPPAPGNPRRACGGGPGLFRGRRGGRFSTWGTGSSNSPTPPTPAAPWRRPSPKPWASSSTTRCATVRFTFPTSPEAIRNDEDLETARHIITEKAIAHLRLRNETFGNPLTEARMAEIDADIHVEPLPVDYRNITPVSPYSA